MFELVYINGDTVPFHYYRFKTKKKFKTWTNSPCKIESLGTGDYIELYQLSVF
jgi:hypothetical protein